jgi:WD40 repeat protein
LWDTRTGELRHELGGYRRQINAVAFASDGNVVAAGGEDRVVRVTDVRTGNVEQSLHGHTDEVKGLAFGRDGILISCGGDGVRVWDLLSGTQRVHVIDDVAGATWLAAGLCRFEPGELDAYRPAPRTT